MLSGGVGALPALGRGLLNTAVVDIDPDTDDDEPRAPQLEETPVLLLAAHNGVRASAYGASVAAQPFADAGEIGRAHV